MKGDRAPVLLCDHSEKSETGLTFVHISRPAELRQRNVQRVVRHHVMTRVATLRRKPPRKTTLAVRLPKLDVTDVASNGSAKPCLPGQTASSRFESIPPSPDPYSLFPVEMDTRARQLIHHSMPSSDAVVSAHELIVS